MKYGDVLKDTYQIIGEIGAGGGAVVYQAKHLRLDADVVVKQIRDEVKGKLDIKGEANVLKNLKHTYLPKIYDFIETEDGIFTVIDFIPGESLDKVIRSEKRISQKRALKWAKQLGEALDYLHSQNPPIVHSDIKPANIIITPDDDVCLIDFNISMALDSHYSDNRGISAGYAAPEQYGAIALSDALKKEYENNTEFFLLEEDSSEGDVNSDDKTFLMSDDDKTVLMSDDKTVFMDENPNIDRGTVDSVVHDKSIQGKKKVKGYVDTRSDIYSLGCVLYHMVTGVIPAKRPDKIIAISNTPAKISEAFEVVIEKMMSFEPKDRYRNGAEYKKVINNLYKIDSRYKAHKRKENFLLATAALFMIVGAVFLAMGIRNNLAQANDEIYSQANDMYLAGDYEGCVNYCIDVLQSMNDSAVFQKNKTGDMADILYVCANACFELGDYQNARNYMHQAIDIKPDVASYYRDYGSILAKCNDISGAKAQLEIAASKGIGDDSLMLLSGEIAICESNYSEAINCLEKASELSNDTSIKKRSMLLLSQTYQSQGNIDKAINVLETAMAQSDSQEIFSISEQLGALYMKKADMSSDGEEKSGYLTKALVIYDSIHVKGFATRQMMENIAILSEETGDFQKAQDTLVDMIDIYPSDYRAYMRLAFLEADIQQNTVQNERDYSAMYVLFDAAKALYEKAGKDDQEMKILENLVNDAKVGGYPLKNQDEISLSFIKGVSGESTQSSAGKKTLKDFMP